MIGLGIFSPYANATATSSIIKVSFQSKPLFQQINVVPGASTQRWIKITNNSDSIQPVAIQATKVSDPNKLSEQLSITISEKGKVLFNDTLRKFLTSGEVTLSSLPAHGKTQYDIAIVFRPNTDDSYQGKSIGFDLMIGFQGRPNTQSSSSGEVLATNNSQGGGGGTPVPSQTGVVIFEDSIAETNLMTSSASIDISIQWTTDRESTSQVMYSAEGEVHSFDLNAQNYGYAHIAPSPEDTTMVINHNVEIDGLLPDTTYYYRVISHASPPTISFEHSFTTPKQSASPAQQDDGQIAQDHSKKQSQTSPNSPSQIMSTNHYTDSAKLNIIGLRAGQTAYLGGELAIPDTASSSSSQYNQHYQYVKRLFASLGLRTFVALSWLIWLILVFITLLIYLINKQRNDKKA